MKLHVRSIYVMLVMAVGALLFSSAARAQLKIGSNPSTINKSSILELESDRQGLLLTRLSDTANINTIMSTEPTANIAGTIIYLDKAPNPGLYMRTAGGYWQQMSGTGQDSTYWRLTGNAGTDSTKDFLGTTDAQAVSIKANNVEAIHITKNADVELPTVQSTTDSLEVLVIDPANGSIIKRKALSAAAFENAIRFLNGLKNEGITLKVDSSTSNPALGYTANAADSSINLSIPVVNDTTKTAGLLSYEDYIKFDSAAADWTTAFSATPDSNGVTVDNVNHVITLHAADETNPGALTATDQNIGGNKTFKNNVVVNGNVGVDGATSLDSTLSVTGKTTLTGQLEADSSALIKGNTTLNNTLGSSITISNIDEAVSGDGNTVLVRNTATGKVVEKDLQQSAYKQLQSGHTGTDINIDSSNANSIIVNVPYASTTARGLVTDSTQTLGGSKTFADSLTVGTGATNKILTVNGKALVTDSLNVNGAVKLDSTLTLSATPNTAAAGQNYVLVRDNVSGKVVQRKIDDGAFKQLQSGSAGTNVNIDSSNADKIIVNVPYASATDTGLVTVAAQTFAGSKTFTDSVTIGSGATNKILTVNGKGLVTDSLNVNGAVKFDSTVTLTATPAAAANGQNYVLVRDTTTGKIVQRKVNDGAFKTLVLGTDASQKDLYIDSSAADKIVINAPDAAVDVRGVVTDTLQTFGGAKNFKDSISVGSTTAANSTFQLNGSLSMNMTTITAATYTVQVKDNTILANATGNAIAITLPAPATITGRIYTIKKIGSGGLDNAVTITPTGGTIDGGANYIIYNDWTFVTLQTDGTNWYIIKK